MVIHADSAAKRRHPGPALSPFQIELLRKPAQKLGWIYL
jgi:hypothetical protein